MSTETEGEDRLDGTPANLARVAQLREAVARSLDVALRRGFYGSVGVTLNVADGTVQKNVDDVHREQR